MICEPKDRGSRTAARFEAHNLFDVCVHLVQLAHGRLGPSMFGDDRFRFGAQLGEVARIRSDGVQDMRERLGAGETYGLEARRDKCDAR